MKTQKFFLFFTLFCLLFTAFGQPGKVQAQAGSAGDLIAEVNALRASNGLGPLEVDGSLMASAQGHSNFMASTGSITHTGAGGTRPHDRAVAAGYGGGATIYISENIAGGNDMSASQTVYSIWSDGLHMSTMLNSSATHIGAGVAVVDKFVYYTIDVGFISGQPAKNPTPKPNTPGQPNNPKTPNAPAPTALPIFAVGTATPAADGSVIHEVQPGQSLWSISNAYKVKVADVKRYNSLNASDIVYPGDKLVIVPSSTPTITPTVTQTPKPPTRTPRPTSTHRPTATLRNTESSTAVAADAATAVSAAEQQAMSPTPATSTTDGALPMRTLGIGMIVICALGVGLVLWSGLRKK